MEYITQGDLLKLITKRFATRPILMRKQLVLYVLFGLILSLIILCCTIGPTPFLAVALIVAFIIVVLAIRHPNFALLLVFAGAGLPMPMALTPLPGHPIRPIEWALLLCIIVIVKTRSSLQLRLPHLLALLFIAIATISFIHVPDISSDYYSSSKRLYELIMSIAALFCGTFLIRYIKDTSSFLIAVLLSNIPLYLIGLGQAMRIPLSPLLQYSFAQSVVNGVIGSTTGGPIIGSATDGRIMGPTAGSVILGSYLIDLLVIALACWLLGARRRDRVIGVIMTVVTILEIVWSGTRSSLIAAIIITIAAFLIVGRFKMLLGTLTIAGITTTFFFNKLLPLFLHNDDSTRPFLWQTAMNLISTHPWIGIGLYQFPKYYSQQLIVGIPIRLAPLDINVHEQYLGWALESGVPFFIVGVLLLLSIIISCSKAYRIVPRKQQILLLAAILAVLANMVAGIFDQPLSFTENGVFFFLLAGLALGYAGHIRWDISVRKTATYPLQSQPISTIGLSSGLYWPHFRPLRTKSPASMQSRASTNEVFSSNDAAPNTQKTGRSVIVQILSWAIPIPIIFPMTGLLAHYFGPTQYGEYSFTLSFLTIIALLSGYGIDPLVTRKLSLRPRAEWRETLSYALGTRLLATIFSMGVAILIAMVLPVSNEQRNLLLLGCVSLFFSYSFAGFRTTYEIGFRTEQRVSMTSLIVATNRIMTAGLVGFIVVFHLPVLWACFLIIYSDLPFFFIQVFSARKRFGMKVRINLVRTRELLLSSLPLIGYNVTSIVAGQADLLFLMALTGAQSAGLYALASKLTDPLFAIVVAYTLGLYPLLCTKFVEGREQFALVCYEAARILALAIVPLAIFVSVMANAIISLIGGQHFAAAAIAMQLLMWAMVATFFNQLAVRACLAAHMERRVLHISAVSLGINILANLILIPRWQIAGAGVAALISELIGLILFALLLRHHIHLFSIIKVVLRVFLGNIPMLLFLIWQQHAPLLLNAPIVLVLTIIGCLATRTFSLKDVYLLRRILYTRHTKRTPKDIGDLSTEILPKIDNIADYPTDILPQVHI